MIICPEFKIGTTQANLVKVEKYGIPVPTNAYIPYALVRTCGNMQQKGFGHPRDTWTWKYLTQTQIWTLVSLIGDEFTASGTVYIQTYKDSGYMQTPAEFRSIMYRPIDGNGKEVVP